MKKLLLASIFFSLIALNSAGQVSFVELWANYAETAPAWFTDGTEYLDGSPSYSGVERGIVYSDYSGHVYVSSRHAVDTDQDGSLDTPEPHVFVLDPATGAAPAFGVSELITTNITSSGEYYGGGYPINNVTATSDGSIFACNLTLASGPDMPDGDYTIIKAFRVYRWDWEQGLPEVVVDYKEGGYRLGDKFSVIGDWTTEAYIYAGAGGTNKVLRWKVTAGVVDASPTIITLQDITHAGTSITVADVPENSDWMYVSGKGLYPTLYTKDGVNLGTISISPSGIPSSLLGGRTIEFLDDLYIGMFCGNQSGFVVNVSKHGDQVTDADIVGYTPTFGTKYANAYGEGAVEFGIIDDTLHIFVCAPSNGIACYKIEGLTTDMIQRELTSDFGVKVYPNPSTEYADFSFTLSDDAEGPVSIKFFDVSGRFHGIIAEMAQPGNQTIRCNTSQMKPGSYVYQIIHDQKFETGQLLIK